MTEVRNSEAPADHAAALRSRVAGAPISWGVCEVPDWGYQLEPGRVLGEMRALGLAATEFGPVGFLEDEPAVRAQQLAAYGLRAVGGFLPVLLHVPGHDPLPEVDAFIDGCLASGAGVVVLAAYTGVDGYDARPVLDDAGCSTLLANHHHVGTMVESGAETERVLAGSRVGLCIDTGHLLVGGADPAVLTARHPDRVEHVHLKDVDSRLAAQVIDGAMTYAEAVRAGMFRPLGEGDVDVAAIVRTLEGAGYQGWYVLEQDVMLDGEPPGEGPVADVRASLDHLLRVAP